MKGNESIYQPWSGIFNKEPELNEEETKIKQAWNALQSAHATVEKRGLEFGRLMYEHREKYWAQGQRNDLNFVQPWTRLETFKSFCKRLDIPRSTAYDWIAKYEISIGKPVTPEMADAYQPQSRNKGSRFYPPTKNIHSILNSVVEGTSTKPTHLTEHTNNNDVVSENLLTAIRMFEKACEELWKIDHELTEQQLNTIVRTIESAIDRYVWWANKFRQAIKPSTKQSKIEADYVPHINPYHKRLA